jgi:hypothetical protein
MQERETRGTVEEIAAQRVVLAEIKARYGTNNTEWRRANFALARLMRRPGPGPQQTKETWRAAVSRNREHRAVRAEERAEKAQINFAEFHARMNGPLIAQNANEILKMGPAVLAGLSKAMTSTVFKERKWAMELYARLLTSLSGKQMAAEPVRKQAARLVRVTWPSEGQKA